MALLAIRLAVMVWLVMALNELGRDALGYYDNWLSADLKDRLERAKQVIGEHAADAEQSGRLADAAVAALRDEGVSDLFLPAGLGGLEVDPVSCALVTEQIAQVDTAAAWFVMVANAPRLMAASWPVELVEKLWGDNRHTLIAASGHTPLQGTLDGDWLVVNGKAGFVSGCSHADFVGAPVLLTGPDGAQLAPELARRMALIPAADCHIEDDWRVLGMRGTNSNSVSVNNVRIPLADTAPIAAQLHVANPYYEGSLYRCPGRVLFATYVPISLAVAGRALDELDQLARQKTPAASSSLLRDRQIAQLKFGKALANYRAARSYFLDSLREAWERAERGEQANDTQRAELYLAGTHGVQAASETVRLVADAAGTSSIFEEDAIARLVRDMEVLRHHGFASENRYASVAQQMWGSELDYPLLLR